jgi:MFS family permease
MLFHLANAALLPLVGQKLAAVYPQEATAMMSACIVAAQAVMLPITLLVGRTADRWGRKPLFLAGFVILPIRAVLYTFSDNSAWLIGVQLLDGVGAGIFGALTPLVIADIIAAPVVTTWRKAPSRRCKGSAPRSADWRPA